MGNVGDAAFSSGDLVRRMTELERLVRELMGGRRLENSTIGGGGLRVADHGVIRSQTFDGNLPLGDAGDAGWALGADRLAIRGQFVGPFSFDRGTGRESNFAITNSQVARAETFIDVPSWAEEAVVFSGHVAQAQNNTVPGGDYLTIQGEIDGSGGEGANFLAVQSGAFAAGSVPHSRLLTELGPTITIATRVNSLAVGGWGAAHVNNFASVTALAFFRRVG